MIAIVSISHDGIRPEWLSWKIGPGCRYQLEQAAAIIIMAWWRGDSSDLGLKWKVVIK